MTLDLESDDPLRDYSEDEQRTLTNRLVLLVRRIHAGGFSNEPLRVELLSALHREIFGGVRGFAGRTRRHDWGAEYLTFGPNRSAHRREVEAELSEILQKATVSLRSLEANSDDPTYEASAFTVAVWTHAEIVRVHPFEDGNGRTSRCLMNVLLVRLGLRPVAVEAVKAEYNDALNTYFRKGGLDLLEDLLLRTYDLGAPE